MTGSSAIAEQAEADVPRPRSSSKIRRRRGPGVSLKTVAGVLGVIGLVVGFGVVLNNLPALSQMGRTLVQSPDPGVSQQPVVDQSQVPVANPPVSNETQPPVAVTTPVVAMPASPPVGTEAPVATIPPPATRPPGNFPNNNPSMTPQPQVPAVITQRESAEDEVDTERGKRLLADVKEIIVIRSLVARQESGDEESDDDDEENTAGTVALGSPPDIRDPVNPNIPMNSGMAGNPAMNGNRQRRIDPKDVIWRNVVARTKNTFEKLGIDQSLRGARRDSAVLIVHVDMKRSKVGKAGTQEVHLSAELTCADPEAESSASRYAVVWKAEQKIGTMSRTAAMSGKVPDSVNENLADFFGKFRAAYNRAVKATKQSHDAANLERSPVRSRS